jgi:hypothetical protein
VPHAGICAGGAGQPAFLPRHSWCFGNSDKGELPGRSGCVCFFLAGSEVIAMTLLMVKHSNLKKKPEPPRDCQRVQFLRG